LGSYLCPASLPAARQILRVAGLIICLGVSVFSTRIYAQPPAPHAEPPGSAIQTIDVASLSSVQNLDGPWRFHFGDDPHFADPALDDSAWPSIRHNQTFEAVGIPFLPAPCIWTRIHLQVPTASGRLALSLYHACPYEIFVNGSSIASTPGLAARTSRNNGSFPVVLPSSGDIALAIRFFCGRYSSNRLPFARVSIGSSRSIQTATELDNLRDLLDRGTLANCAWLPVVLLMAATAMILYRAQRDHDEYLWFGILCLDFALYTVIGDNAFVSGWLPRTLPMIMLGNYTGWLCSAIQLEFIMRFSRVRRRWPIRILQGLILIGPVLAVTSTRNLYLLTLVIVFAAITAVETVCLVSAYRRGMADAGLMLVPCTASAVINLVFFAALTFPAVVPWGRNFHFGPVSMPGNYFASIPFNLGIIAVVLYRFIRVARDEERAASELEAARTVQQILVPEEVPSIAGFSIQAVYHPAGEVGGDFYQVLPAPNGGLLAVIGDVSGKGMPAAMTVSLLVGTVRTLAQYTHDPAEILTAMNQRMIGRGNGGFTTALALRLDPDGTVTAANAGHIAPYANGQELDIDNGLPLGITAAAAYNNSTLHLEANITLTLLTDGVVEAQNAKGELFGFDRSRALSGRPVTQIVEAARAFGQQDDITVVALRCTGVPAAALAPVPA
jgi:hypothetical protein